MDDISVDVIDDISVDFIDDTVGNPVISYNKGGSSIIVLGFIVIDFSPFSSSSSKSSLYLLSLSLLVIKVSSVGTTVYGSFVSFNIAFCFASSSSASLLISAIFSILS